MNKTYTLNKNQLEAIVRRKLDHAVRESWSEEAKGYWHGAIYAYEETLKYIERLEDD